MRKTRCLAFCQRHQRVARRARPGVGIGFRGSGMPPALPLLQYGPLCAGDAGLPSTVRSAPLCDPTTSIVDGGTTVADGPTRSTTVTGGQSRSPRVVVSNPDSSSRFSSWRRSDSERPGTDQCSGLAR